MRRGAADTRSGARQGLRMDGPVVAQRELLEVVCWSGCGLEAGVDVGRDQVDLLRGEGLPGRLEGGAEHAAGKDRDAVH